MRTAAGIVAAGLVAALPLAGQDDPLPRTGSFMVNSVTAGHQLFPDVAADGADNYQIVWQSAVGEPVHQDVRIRTMLASTEQLSEEPLAQSTTRDQREPAISMEADGDWVAIWTSDHSEEDERRPVGRYTSEGGTVLEDQFTFDFGDAISIVGPDVAIVDDGHLIGAWRVSSFDGEIAGNLRSRKAEDLGSSGIALGASAGIVSLAGLGDEHWVAAWHEPDASSNGAFLRCFVAEIAADDEIPAHADAAGDQVRPDVASLGFGRFAAAWTSGGVVVGRIFQLREDGSCTPVDPQFEIAAAGTSPRIAAGPDGAFVVAWEETTLDADGGIAAREFHHDGVPIGDPFGIHSPLDQLQDGPAVAVSASTFLVAWNHASKDGEDPVERDIGAASFHRRLVFSDGFELADRARWSEGVPPSP